MRIGMMNTRKAVGIAFVAGVLALSVPGPVSARTKLTTLPEREALALSLDHPQVNLVTEERVLTLQQGVNEVDFSWQGVSIDSGSIQIQVLDHPGEGPESTKVLNVSYPPNENALTWKLFSPEARTERVRIYYLLGGFARVDSYQATVEADERTATAKEYLRLSNVSGEDLSDARIGRGFGQTWTRGLENGETKRLLSFVNAQMPVTKVYITRPDAWSQRGEEGEIISLVYEVRNEKDSGFGDFLLPAGKVRIYQKDPEGTIVFLGEDVLGETPVKEKAELSLGQVKDVTVKRFIQSDERVNVKRNDNRNVVLFDRRVHVRYELQNFKKDPVTLKIVERMSDDWEIEELDTRGVRHEIENNGELHIFVDLEGRPADEKAEMPKKEVNFIYVMRNQMP